jgi:hypothetical protein
MKLTFMDQQVREAWGRILRDAQSPGDGKMVLEALENIREMVAPRLVDACALQAEWGRRKLAHDLIEIGREEFERVSTPLDTHASVPGAGSPGFGSKPGGTIAERGRVSVASLGKLATRRRGPAASYKPET